MDQNPSYQANSHPTGLKILCPKQNVKIRHLIYSTITSPCPGPAESSIKSCSSFKIHFNIIVPPISTTKILMYKVLIRPVLIYASETWTDSKPNEWRLGFFERKVLRCIFGAKQENEIWQKRYNYELYKIFID
jgi:hypothetical protein